MSRSKNVCGTAHGCVGLDIIVFYVSVVLCSGSRGHLVRPRSAVTISRVHVQSVLRSACPKRSTGHDCGCWDLGLRRRFFVSAE